MELLESDIQYAIGTALQYCKELRVPFESQDEVICSALYGLVLASKDYIEDSASFSTYARYRILGTIKDDYRQRTQWRKKNPPKFVPLEYIANIGSDGLETRTANKELTHKILDELSLQESSVLGLYYLEGWTMKEIGKKLGMSEGYISLMHKEALNSARKVYRKLS